MAWQALVSVDETAARLVDPRLRVFDCRHELGRAGAGREAYGRGHLPGAIHVDLDHDLSGAKTASSGRHPLPAPGGYAARLRAWGVDAHSLLLAYDDAGGIWAARFWWMTARWLGHPHVAVLDGGLRLWIERGLPVTTEVPPPRPAGTFEPTHDPATVVSADETAAAARDPSRLVLDARAVERYRGDAEPIDAVAGHIPGARNLPTTSLLAAGGTLRPRRELAELFRDRLGGTAPESVVAYCGSGVTACHLLLGMERAGLTGARLYPGSWSEWSRDPSRPVARGDAP